MAYLGRGELTNDFLLIIISTGGSNEVFILSNYSQLSNGKERKIRIIYVINLLLKL